MANTEQEIEWKVGDRPVVKGVMYEVISVSPSGVPDLKVVEVVEEVEEVEEDRFGIEDAGGLARTFGQGASFGFSDELRGVARGLNPFDEIKGFGAGYKSGRDAEREALEQFREDHPKAAFAAELGGGLATGLLVPGAAARTIPMLGRGLRSAQTGKRVLSAGALGAGEGAVAGAGFADEGDRLAGAGYGGLIGGGLGVAAGKLLPGTVQSVGGGRSVRGGGTGSQVAEVIEQTRGGPTRRTPSLPDPRSVPVPPVQMTGQGLMSRGAGRARQALDWGQEYVKRAELGLLRPTQEAVEEAVNPILKAGSRRFDEIEDAVESAGKAFDKLDADFATGWSGKLRPNMTGSQIDDANRELVDVLQRIADNKDVAKVFKGSAEGWQGADMTAIRNLERAIVSGVKGGKNIYVNPTNVKRLGHKEVKALWQNLRHMSGDVADADVLFRELDVAYRKLFGKGTDKATNLYKSAIQDSDSYKLGAGINKGKTLANRSMKNPGMFNITGLRTVEGLEGAIKQIQKHKGVADSDRAVGNFLEGLFDKEVRSQLTDGTKARSALEKLASNPQWLRQFYPDTKAGEKAFKKAMREIRGGLKEMPNPNKQQTLWGLLGGWKGIGTGAFLYHWLLGDD
jgi:hypothetical protein